MVTNNDDCRVGGPILMKLSFHQRKPTLIGVHKAHHIKRHIELKVIVAQPQYSVMITICDKFSPQVN